MNLKLVTSAAMLAALAAPASFADTGTITFNGTISSVTCKVSGEGGVGPDFVVNLGGIQASDLGTPSDAPQTKTAFRIYVGGADDTNCTDGTRVYAHFEPDFDLVDEAGRVKVTDVANGAKNVAIRLLTEDDNVIDIISNQPKVTKTVAGNQAVLIYKAGYVATGEGTVTAGKADGSVRYTIYFEA